MAELLTAATSALIGAVAAYFMQNHVLPYQKRKEKASMALAELANATRHFERSVQNLDSFIKSKSGRKLGRPIDYEKCKYSASGFVGLSYSDLMGLRDKISRDLMQMGMVYRNTSLEVDAVISEISSAALSDEDNQRKFDAMIALIGRMKTIVSMSRQLHQNVHQYRKNVRALNANREIDWPDDFYSQGDRQGKDA